jgi:hypothetical protein
MRAAHNMQVVKHIKTGPALFCPVTALQARSCMLGDSRSTRSTSSHTYERTMLVAMLAFLMSGVAG